MNRKQLAKFAALGLVPAGATVVAPALAGTTFNWSGAGQSGGWSNIANWNRLDVQRDYPGDEATNDRVIIDHNSPRTQVVDNPSVTLEYMFVGHDHELVLDNDIVVTSEEEESGVVRFEGDVTISGSGAIRAKGVLVNSKTRATRIATEGYATIVTN